MFIEDEGDMTARFLEFLEEIIERLRERYFHDFLEIERLEFIFPVSFTLKLKCFSKRDNIIDIIGRLSTNWDS